MKRIAIAFTLLLLGAQAHAFGLSIGYTGEVTFSEFMGVDYWGYSEGDSISGVFHFETDDIGSADEFIDSTHAPAGANIDIIHDEIGPDEVLTDMSGGNIAMEITNLGGSVDLDTLVAELLFESISVEFDESLIPEGLLDPVWIDGGDLVGSGSLLALAFTETSEGPIGSLVDFDLTSLHIEFGDGPATLLEPGSMGLFGIGLIALGWVRRKIAV